MDFGIEIAYHQPVRVCPGHPSSIRFRISKIVCVHLIIVLSDGERSDIRWDE